MLATRADQGERRSWFSNLAICQCRMACRLELKSLLVSYLWLEPDDSVHQCSASGPYRSSRAQLSILGRYLRQPCTKSLADLPLRVSDQECRAISMATLYMPLCNDLSLADESCLDTHVLTSYAQAQAQAQAYAWPFCTAALNSVPSICLISPGLATLPLIADATTSTAVPTAVRFW